MNIRSPFEPSQTYMASGSILISRSMPTHASAPTHATPHKQMAPLLGYFPPASAYLPADNETWIAIEKSSNTIVVHKGTRVVKEIKGHGSVDIEAGKYYLQYKQKSPLWYAPDEYFHKRQLMVPPKGGRLRYRKGALGSFALFPTNTFAIHSAAIWNEEVGGLSIPSRELAAIYHMLPLGTAIVISD